jgi:hypothetical protein
MFMFGLLFCEEAAGTGVMDFLGSFAIVAVESLVREALKIGEIG